MVGVPLYPFIVVNQSAEAFFTKSCGIATSPKTIFKKFYEVISLFPI